MCKLDEEAVENIWLELRTCCSPQVNKLLFEYVLPEKLNVGNKKELLDHTKSVAVKVVHKDVH